MPSPLWKVGRCGKPCPMARFFQWAVGEVGWAKFVDGVANVSKAPSDGAVKVVVEQVDLSAGLVRFRRAGCDERTKKGA